LQENMPEDTEKIPLIRIKDNLPFQTKEVVVREFPLTLFLNGQELVTLLCSPNHLKYLALGFLVSEGLIASREDIKKVLVDETLGIVRVETHQKPNDSTDLVFKRFITSGCGRGAAFYSPVDVSGHSKVESKTEISFQQVIALMKEFQHASELYKTTHGVHSAALSDGDKFLIFRDDIGRHNAIDKIFGECLWSGISTDQSVIVTSGRMSSEILFKVAKRGVPILISKSAPTSLSVQTASDLGVTLIGFVRGSRFDVFANDWRITGTKEESATPGNS
jgi:FdhD protein